MSRTASVGWFARVALTMFIVIAAVSMAFLRVPLADQGAGIRSIAPPAAFVGDVVTITGAGFGGRNVRVFVGGVPATIVDVVQGGGTPSSVTFRVPLVPAGPTQVVAMNPGGRAWSAGFHVLNHPPVADAGLDQTVGVGTTVQLDGRGSTDVDGDALTFRWTIVSRPPGSGATLSDPTALRPTFLVDRRGTYVVQLVVNDGGSDSAPDTVRIDTTNSAPVADAGPDQTVPRGATVQLDGTGSSDIDGDLLAFRWAFQSRPPGSQATLTDGSIDGPAFVADLPGRYVLELVVSDGLLDSKPATVRIDTRNSRPQSSAGADLVVTVGTTVQLDGSASSDADGDPLGFRWSFTTRPAGSAAVLSDVTAIQPTFAADVVGTYVVQLIVNDPFEDGAPDTVAVTAQPATAANRAPTVSAGANQSITLPTNTATLNGSASDDGLPGGVLVTTWSKVTGPGTVIFADASATSTTAQFSLPGTYVLRLTASDGALSTSADVTVTVNPAAGANQPPVVNAGSNQTITLPASASLSGTVSDDGLPGPLTTTWSMVSGPGTVTFADVSAPTTTASFSAGGSYVLRLTANDGELTASADVTVTVNPAVASGFSLELVRTTASPFADSTALILFRIVRADGFTAPISVRLLNTPAGISGQTVHMLDLSEGALILEVASTVAPGTASVDVVAEGGGLIQSAPLALTILAAQPTSLAKIHAAMVDGTLDRPTSLLYRAYALFGDPRLPEPYRGSGSANEDIGLLAEIADVYPTLSPDMRALLEPFTLRPAADGSWYNQLIAPVGGATPSTARSAFAAAVADPSFLPANCSDLAPKDENRWVSRRSTVFPVRVWATCVAEAPEKTEKMIEFTLSMFDYIWPAVTNGPMGAPKADKAADAPITRADAVGDDAMDVYLVFPAEEVVRLGVTYAYQKHALGWAFGWPFRSTAVQKSGFIVLPWTSVQAASFHGTAIHELFHVLQFGSDALLLRGFEVPQLEGVPNAPTRPWWYVEASAEWAEAHYDQRLAPWESGRQARSQVYERFATLFQQRGSEVPLNDRFEDRPYEAFIWPYFMEQMRGGTFPASVWTALAGAADPDAADRAMNAVFSFKDNFREFAVRNLNTGEFEPGDPQSPLPEDKRYVALDRDEFPDGVKPNYALTQIVTVDSETTLTINLAPLAAHYSEWRIGDLKTKKVVVDLEAVAAVAGDLGLDVDAMVNIFDRGWKRENYNGRKKVTFCMDEDEQALATLVLVISRHELQPPSTSPAQTKVKVTATSAPCEPMWVGRATNDFRSSVLSLKVTADVTWHLGFDAMGPDGPLQTFTPEGIVTVDLLVSLGTPCTIAPSTVGIAATDGSMVVNYPPGGHPFVTTIQGNSSWQTTQTCGSFTMPSVMSAEWIPTHLDALLLSEDGKTISASFGGFSDDGLGQKSSFEFTLKRQ